MLLMGQMNKRFLTNFAVVPVAVLVAVVTGSVQPATAINLTCGNMSLKI